jgi:hypothetical protein
MAKKLTKVTFLSIQSHTQLYQASRNCFEIFSAFVKKILVAHFIYVKFASLSIKLLKKKNRIGDLVLF